MSSACLTDSGWDMDRTKKSKCKSNHFDWFLGWFLMVILGSSYYTDVVQVLFMFLMSYLTLQMIGQAHVRAGPWYSNSTTAKILVPKDVTGARWQHPYPVNFIFIFIKNRDGLVIFLLFTVYGLILSIKWWALQSVNFGGWANTLFKDKPDWRTHQHTDIRLKFGDNLLYCIFQVSLLYYIYLSNPYGYFNLSGFNTNICTFTWV